MARLGELERATMEVLWRHPEGRFARQLTADLPTSPALTTVLTVLERLSRKGLVDRVKEGRAHRYLACASKQAYVAEAMRAALADADDMPGALTHFLGDVSPEQRTALRAALDHLDGEPQ